MSWIRPNQEFDFCSNETLIFFNETTNRNNLIDAVELYKYFCPPLIAMSFISVLINAILFVVGHKYTRNKSPVLLLSLNLASTDTLTSGFAGLGLLLNAYLPVVFKISFNNQRCWLLGLEIIRTAAFIASVLHHTALAGLHYRGIKKPLHYR